MGDPIIFFQPTLNRNGGIERLTSTLLKRFSDNHACIVLSAYPPEDTFPLNAHVYSLSELKSAQPITKMLKVFSRARALASFYAQHGPAIVVASADGCIISALLAKVFIARRMCVIAFMHQEITKSSIVHRVLLRMLLPYANAVVGVSEGITNELRPFVSSERLTRIYNATDVASNENDSQAPLERQEDESYFSGKGPVFVCIGRLTYQKAQWRAIEAMAEVVRAHPHARLLIIGDGPLRPLLEARIAERGLQASVHLLGIRKNVFPYVRRARALVLPSYFESFGLVLVEALSVGSPIVATDCDFGPREITDMASPKLHTYPSRTPYGFLVAVPREGIEAYPAEESLVAALASMASEALSFDAAELRARAEAFDIAQVADQWESVFQGLPLLS